MIRMEAHLTNEPPYEPPQIESVLTAEDLAREIQYAGREFTGPV